MLLHLAQSFPIVLIEAIPRRIHGQASAEQHSSVLRSDPMLQAANSGPAHAGVLGYAQRTHHQATRITFVYLHALPVCFVVELMSLHVGHADVQQVSLNAFGGLTITYSLNEG